MTIFQWIFITFSAVQALRCLLRIRTPRTSRSVELVFLFIWVAAIIVLIQHEATMQLAPWLGITRGADLFVYSFCFFSLWAHYQMYLRYKHLESCHTLLVRNWAIDTARAPEAAELAEKSREYAGIYVVIAAYNEAKRLPFVLEGLLPTFVNLVVVDDGSRDATYETAARFPVHVLQHRINRGQGAAIQTGMTYSLMRGAEAIVTFDADNQHSPADLPRMLKPVLHGECDVTLGSRFLGGSSNVPWTRRILLRAARWITWATSGLFLTDSHNGLRVFSRRAAQSITLRQDRMAHASEIYDQISQARLSFQEVPVTIRYTSETLAKGQSATNAANVLFHYLFGKLRK